MSAEVADIERRVRALLESDRVTAATRLALVARLDWRRETLRTFTAAEAETLAAAAARLLPTPGLGERIDAIGRLDAALASGPGDGWRYAELPTDIEAYRAAARGLDACARALGQDRFVALAHEAQDEVLRAVQDGVPTPAWSCSASLWFKDFLAALSEIVFGHPLVQEQMGYDGMADAHGWSAADVTGPHA